MGYRLHFAKVHKVEWDGGYFSGSELDQVAEMLVEELESFWQDENSDIWEVNKEELKDYIGKLRSFPPADKHAYLKEDYTNQDMIEILTKILKNSEPDEDYIRIEWF